MKRSNMVFRFCMSWIFLAATAAAAPADVDVLLTRDLDGDGREERLCEGPNGFEFQSWNAESETWEATDHALPGDVTPVDEAGNDAGLRFVDLNGDGFEDLLFSNRERIIIYLWTTEVRPDLGWERGWTHRVKSAIRRGAPGELPSLVGSGVHIDDGMLIITEPPSESAPGKVHRLSMKGLIAAELPPPKEPAAALVSIRVPNGYEVQLAASEPVVIDPVNFAWGADGRLWVVEMRDYPTGIDGDGEPGGVVKILHDPDGDGVYDSASIFLEGLSFPTAVMPWRNGALVAAAPDLIYAEDLDHDGRAEKREALFTGFTPGNQQHRFNGFEWGLDGWIYGANGDSGGRIESTRTGRAVSISGRDFRFRPDSGELEAVSAQSQFGRRRDDWGNWFGNDNITWLWHVTLPEHYLRRNPNLAVKSVKNILADYANSTRVFPSSKAMVRPNQPWSLNHVTSACSPSPYRDDWLSDELASSILICEPVHNLVHREVLIRDGASFRSRRAESEAESEFLTSDDNWFRPVTIKTGPDGALYIADMYRLVLEHPEWIPREMQQRMDVRAGSDRGRIYRIVRQGAELRPIPNLAKLDPSALAQAMDSRSGWQRDMVQQLLLERGSAESAPILRELLALTHAPQVRLQALATLGTLDALDRSTVLAALADPHPAVRMEALRQSERLAASDVSLFESVAALAEDGDAEVRLQAAFSLGSWAPEMAEPVLREMVSKTDVGELQRIAVMSSLRSDSELFSMLTSQSAGLQPTGKATKLVPSSAERAQVIADYSPVRELPSDPQHGQKHFEKHCMVCHRFRGAGRQMGPDLEMVAGKPTDWMLTAILDPNQSVAPRYRSWTVLLNSGETLAGIVSAETANNLVLQMADGTERALLRTDIELIDVSELSPMPVGFEDALSKQDMADLLNWLGAVDEE